MLHCTDLAGDGPALVFVHGILMNETVWHKQVAAFRDTHRVVTLDMAGFGKSTGTGNESNADHARMIDELLAHLELKDITFVGWSKGGAIGQVMGHIAPGRLRRLVLVDTTPQLVADDKFDLGLPPEALDELGEAFGADFAAGCDGFAQLCAGEDPGSATFLADLMKGTDPEVAFNSLGTSVTQSQVDILDKIHVETHVIHGEQDKVCVPAAGTFLAERISGCAGPAIMIKDAGHAPFLTQSEAFNKAFRPLIS
jgi:pimeloyl-ACP methyl ester carboxylesterase